MAMQLTDSQRDHLRHEPVPAGHTTKIRLAIRLADASTQRLADAAGVPYQQLSRYINGGDLLLSTAARIAEVFGLTVSDLWPTPPAAKADRRKKVKRIKATSRKRINPKVSDPKAKAA